MGITRFGRSALVVALAGGLLSACGNVTPRKSGPEFSTFDPRTAQQRAQYGTITDRDGFTLLGSQSRERKAARGNAGTAGTGIGVNAFLWRASLETIDFMPLASADPFGGLIITEWYQPSDTPDERFKLNVLIRDTALRADGVSVSVFRQKRSERGEWLDAEVNPATATSLEDKILTRARELRIAAVDQS